MTIQVPHRFMLYENENYCILYSNIFEPLIDLKLYDNLDLSWSVTSNMSGVTLGFVIDSNHRLVLNVLNSKIHSNHPEKSMINGVLPINIDDYKKELDYPLTGGNYLYLDLNIKSNYTGILLVRGLSKCNIMLFKFDKGFFIKSKEITNEYHSWKAMPVLEFEASLNRLLEK